MFPNADVARGGAADIEAATGPIFDKFEIPCAAEGAQDDLAGFEDRAVPLLLPEFRVRCAIEGFASDVQSLGRDVVIEGPADGVS